ncbi:hypothetical protein OK142_13275 [Agrobacterium sp. BT-220-3]|nr:hypothetical protein [Rhizobium oryzihabitans]MCW0981786.1 hypothetical protein [Agrobacterium sp. BT-220-3]
MASVSNSPARSRSKESGRASASKRFFMIVAASIAAKIDAIWPRTSSEAG